MAERSSEIVAGASRQLQKTIDCLQSLGFPSKRLECERTGEPGPPRFFLHSQISKLLHNFWRLRRHFVEVASAISACDQGVFVRYLEHSGETVPFDAGDSPPCPTLPPQLAANVMFGSQAGESNARSNVMHQSFAQTHCTSTILEPSVKRSSFLSDLCRSAVALILEPIAPRQDNRGIGEKTIIEFCRTRRNVYVKEMLHRLLSHGVSGTAPTPERHARVVVCQASFAPANKRNLGQYFVALAHLVFPWQIQGELVEVRHLHRPLVDWLRALFHDRTHGAELLRSPGIDREIRYERLEGLRTQAVEQLPALIQKLFSRRSDWDL